MFLQCLSIETCSTVANNRKREKEETDIHRRRQNQRRRKSWFYIIALRTKGIDDWRQLENTVYDTFHLTEKQEKDLPELIRLSEPKRLREFYLKMTVNELRKDNLSYREIGKLLGISKDKAHRLHEDWSKPPRCTIKELARWYGVSEGTIRNALKKSERKEKGQP